MLIAQCVLAGLLLFIALLVGAWDITCYALQVPEYTVSTIMGYWSSEVPALPFAIGFLAGHIFWPRVPWHPLPPITRP